MSHQVEIENLISTYERRLQALQERNAKLGYEAPVSLQLEIEDVELELKKLREELTTIKSRPAPTYHSQTAGGSVALSDSALQIAPFEVQISRYGPVRYRAKVVAPSGQAATVFQLPLQKPVIEATLADFRANLYHTRKLSRDAPFVPQVEQALTPEQLGAALFEAVFQPDVLKLFNDSYRQIRRARRSLPILLNIAPETGDLINLPWEFLYNSSTQRFRGQFMAFSQDTPVIRRWLDPSPLELTYDPPLRILLVSANPEGAPLLNVQKEYRLILNKFKSNYKVRVDYLPAAGLDDIKKVVRNQDSTPHVIHFMGHGGLGQLLFEDREGGRKSVSDQSLSIIFRNAPSLRLVVLNACETAQTDLLARQLGVAQCLADDGIPAVVAMQFAISDEAALAFADEFYQLLTEGHSVDSAVTWGRIAIQNAFEDKATKEWATPVLYLQAPDGDIFPDLLTEKDQAYGGPSRTDTAGGIGSQPAAINQEDPPSASKTEQMRREAQEKSEQIEQLQKLRQEYLTQLQAREESARKQGVDVDPHTTVTIATLRRQIKEVERELTNLDPEITFGDSNPVTPVPLVKQPEQGQRKDRQTTGFTAVTRSQADKLYQRGQFNLEKGEWGQALSDLSLAQKLSDLPDIDNLVKKARQSWQQTREGKDQYDFLLPVLYDQATQRLEEKDVDKAAALFEQIVKIDADYENAYELALSTRASAEKEKEERKKQARLEGLYTAAKSHYEDRNWTEAVDLFTQVIDIDESYLNAQELLNEAIKQRDLLLSYQQGNAAIKAKDWVKAVAAFGKVASIDAEYGEVGALLAKCRYQRQLDTWTQEAIDYLDEGSWEAAIEVLEDNEVAEQRQEAKLALYYAYACRSYEQRHWSEAVKHLKYIISTRPNYRPDLNALYQNANQELHLQQLFNKAINYQKDEEWLAAKATLESIIQVRPDYPQARNRLNEVNEVIRLADLYKKAMDAIELKQWAKAIPYLKEISHYKDAQSRLEEAQRQVELVAHYKDGIEAAGNGDWDSAVAAFQRVTDIDPDYQDVQVQLKVAQDKVTLEQSYLEGVKAFQVGQERDLGQLEQAIEYFETVANIDPRYRGVKNRLREAKREKFLLDHYLEGDNAFQAGNWAKAIKHWQVIVKDENEPEYRGDSARRLTYARHQQHLADLLQQAQFHYENQEWDNAIMLLEQLQQETTDEPYGDTSELLHKAKLQRELANHFQQATQLAAAEQWDRVIEHLTQIKAMQPDYRPAEVERMLVEAQTNGEAMRHYQIGLEALTNEDWDQAVSSFKRVYDLKSDFQDVSTRLQQARQQQTLHTRYQAAQEAITAENWSTAIEHLSVIQSLDPDFKEARKLLETAELQRELANDYQVAQGHYASERWLEARRAFDVILERDKDYKNVQFLRDEAQKQLDIAATYEEAVQKIEAATEKPENWQIAVQLLTQIEENDYEDAVRLLAGAKQQANLYGKYQKATVLGLKTNITDVQQAIDLLNQIIREDPEYKNVIPLKAEYEEKVRQLKADKKKVEIKTKYELAIENTRERKFDQVVKLLHQIIELDSEHQSALTAVNKTIQQVAQLSADVKQLREARRYDEAKTVTQEYKKAFNQLPDRIEAILQPYLPQ